MANMEKNNQNQISQSEKGGNKGSNNGWKVASAVCIAVAVIALAVFGIQKSNQAKREAELAALAAQNTIPVESAAESTEQKASQEGAESASPEPKARDIQEVLAEKGVTVPEKAVDFATLQEKTNKDIYAWIYIPDSMIDYPVLQHPTDNVYYLEYNLDGSKGYPGCIYTENYNKKDFSDPVTVMYGHNMKSGAMFAGLHKYEDPKYFEEHPYVYVYTPEKLLVYQIFAAEVYSDLHILLNHDFTSPLVYKRFLEEVTTAKGMSNNYNENIEVTADDKILVMSTCISSQPNNRYIVLGVLLNED